MKKLFLLVYILFIYKSKAQEWVTPIIDGYGKIKYSKNIAVQPDNNLEYKIVYKITSNETREGINKGLNGIAHAINMLGCANIQNNKVKIVATIQGQAINIILNNNAYQKKFGKDNPNTEVIRLLSDYGVDLYVCSQATAYKKINKSDINKNITEALSGSSVLLNYQLNGYALMQ